MAPDRGGAGVEQLVHRASTLRRNRVTACGTPAATARRSVAAVVYASRSTHGPNRLAAATASGAAPATGFGRGPARPEAATPPPRRPLDPQSPRRSRASSPLPLTAPPQARRRQTFPAPTTSTCIGSTTDTVVFAAPSCCSSRVLPRCDVGLPRLIPRPSRRTAARDPRRRRSSQVPRSATIHDLALAGYPDAAVHLAARTSKC
jgi:hypothetical protein